MKKMLVSAHNAAVLFTHQDKGFNPMLLYRLLPVTPMIRAERIEGTLKESSSLLLFYCWFCHS